MKAVLAFVAVFVLPFIGICIAYNKRVFEWVSAEKYQPTPWKRLGKIAFVFLIGLIGMAISWAGIKYFIPWL